MKADAIFQKLNTVAGCLYGMAIGDALAAPVEFIRSDVGVNIYYAQHGFGEGALIVTDDTQIALTVKEERGFDVQFVVEPMRSQ